jgi:hypothetical protein
MINVIHVVRMPLPIRSMSQRTKQSLDPTYQRITGTILSFFNLEFKFLLMYESNFHVAGFSYGSNIHDAMGRVSHRRADSKLPPPSPPAGYWPPPPLGGYWPPPLPIRHLGQSSSTPPTFEPGILAAVVGTYSWRASPWCGECLRGWYRCCSDLLHHRR